jgi:hypothetical protein
MSATVTANLSRCRPTTAAEGASVTVVLTQAAVDYAKRGLRVLPLQPREKIPVSEQWQDLATADPARVESTWERMRTASAVEEISMTKRSDLAGEQIRRGRVSTGEQPEEREASEQRYFTRRPEKSKS